VTRTNGMIESFRVVVSAAALLLTLQGCQSGGLFAVFFPHRSAPAGPPARAISDAERLFHAAEADDTGTIRSLLKSGTDVNAPFNHYTPLMATAIHGHTRAVGLLLSRGADVNAKDLIGETALLFAVINNNQKCVDQLLAGGADPNAQTTPQGTTPLLQATEFGRIGIVRSLLAAGADVNLPDAQGSTPLMLAARTTPELVPVLVERGAHVDDVDTRGFTALLEAASNGHTETVGVLLDRGADINAAAVNGWTALLFAVQTGHIETTELLIKRHANVNVKDTKGNTALMLAKSRGNAAGIDLLMNAGAKE
jgi:ankyrin repeat protein